MDSTVEINGVMVLVLCTLTDDALYLCKFSESFKITEHCSVSRYNYLDKN